MSSNPEGSSHTDSSDRNSHSSRAPSDSTQDPTDLQLDLHTLIQKLRDMGLFIQDVERGRVFPNRLWYSWGYTDDDMRYGHFLEFVHPEDRSSVSRAVENLERDKPYTDVKFRIRTASGEWRWIHSNSIAITRNADGSIRRYIGFDYDLTEQVQAQQRAERLAREAETLASAAAIINNQEDLSGTICAILEQAKLVLPFKNASVQLLRYDRLELVGGTGFADLQKVLGITFPIPGDNPNTEVVQTREARRLGPELRLRYPRFREIAGADITNWMGIPLINRNELIGMITFDRSDGTAFTDHEMALAGGFGNHVSVALRNAQLYEQMRELSIRDELTGCYNRRWMYEMIGQQMELGIRYAEDLSLIIFDLDDFKSINDTYGHIAGDRILKTATEITRDALRSTDTLFRFGGEEFVILLPHTDQISACEIGNRIRLAVQSHPWFPDGQDAVTISLGCSSLREDEPHQPEALLARADNALLQAKRGGKNRCIGYACMCG